MTPEELEGMNGRRALVEGVIETTNSPDAVGVVDHDGFVRVRFAHKAGGYLSGVAWLLPSAIREILPEPIKVGSVVKEGEVLAIHGSQVWIKELDGLCFTYPLSELTIVEPGQ